ncbi:Protein argonaute 4A [Bienertia sinuspersici]
MSNEKGRPDEAELPPPPSVVPSGVTPIQESELLAKSTQKRLPMARSGPGMKGQKISLLTNHFQVKMPSSDGHFYQYSVKMAYEDGTVVETKGIGRKVLDKLHETYESELGGKQFAYDGEKTLFTLGDLPRKKLESVGRGGSPGEEDTNGDKKRFRRPQRSKTYKVELTYATKIPLQAITIALRGQDSEHFQEAVRVLDTILRQHAARQGCLLVRQSFFHNEPRNFTDIGGGVLGCRGFHSSFRATQGGLSLNIDVSTTMIVQPGPVIDFLTANQNVGDPNHIDWAKAKKTLKSLRVIARPSNMEFELKQRNGNGESQSVEITVYEYFVQHRNIKLKYSGDFPCINVGKPKRPTYFPIEALKSSNYAADPLLKSSGILISNQFARVEGRVLQAPQLTVGHGENFSPRNGRWNFNNKELFQATDALKTWIIVNFSARVDMNMLTRDIVKCGKRKGMNISDPFKVSTRTLKIEDRQLLQGWKR